MLQWWGVLPLPGYSLLRNLHPRRQSRCCTQGPLQWTWGTQFTKQRRKVATKWPWDLGQVVSSLGTLVLWWIHRVVVEEISRLIPGLKLSEPNIIRLVMLKIVLSTVVLTLRRKRWLKLRRESHHCDSFLFSVCFPSLLTQQDTCPEEFAVRRSFCFWASPCSMQDLSSPTNMEPVSPAVEALSLKSLDHQGSPNMLLFKKKKNSYLFDCSRS